MKLNPSSPIIQAEEFFPADDEVNDPRKLKITVRGTILDNSLPFISPLRTPKVIRMKIRMKEKKLNFKNKRKKSRIKLLACKSTTNFHHVVTSSLHRNEAKMSNVGIHHISFTLKLMYQSHE